MIEKLTAAQEAKFPEYVNKWVQIGLNTDECNFAIAKGAVVECYENAGLPAPEIFIGPLNNPLEAAVAEFVLNEWSGENRQFKNGDELNQKVIAEIKKRSGKKMDCTISNQIYGNQEFWLSSYDFFQTECGLDCCSKIGGLNRLAKECGWWTPLAGIAILQHRPAEIHRDTENRIHNVSGAAIKFRGEEVVDVYAVHGVRVTKKIINREYTVAEIEKEVNVEVRRVMIELYGQVQYLLDTKAKVVHVDDFGTLYAKDLSNDETLMMVKVVNSTVEPDGSFKDYFIRVDPKAYGGLKTGKSAVASTWRNRDGTMVFSKPEEYDPAVQT